MNRRQLIFLCPPITPDKPKNRTTPVNIQKVVTNPCPTGYDKEYSLQFQHFRIHLHLNVP